MGYIKTALVLAVCCISMAYGQTINVLCSIEHEQKVKELKFELTDSAQINPLIANIIADIYDEGFLNPVITKDWINNQTLAVRINKGHKYSIATIQSGNADELALRYAKFNTRKANGSPAIPKKIADWNEKIVQWYENNGYPFASSSISVISLKNDSLFGFFNVAPGRLVLIDSIVQKGQYRFSNGYLENYLGIRDGDLYNEKRVQKIQQRINELSFIEITHGPEIIFTENGALIFLYFKKKRANRFDGIIGFAPDPNNSYRLLLTGEVNMGLVNSFNHGESIDLKWRSMGNGTQDIKASVIYPYLFSLPFGLDAELSIYRKDTSYITTKRVIGLDYLLSAGSALSGYYESGSSSVISSSLITNTIGVPLWADVNTSLFGTKVHYVHFDYLLNPRKGWSAQINLASGNKTIFPHPDVDPIAYNTLDLKTRFTRLTYLSALHIPLGKLGTFRIQAAGGAIWNPALFKNELFLIGGLQLLRGFDELGIPASQYTVLTGEYRYLFERNAYLSIFTDVAQTSNQTTNADENYWSLGTGISFDSKAGIFSLYYALGKNWQDPFNFRSGKIHFGLTARF